MQPVKLLILSHNICLGNFEWAFGLTLIALRGLLVLFFHYHPPPLPLNF